MCDLYAWHSNWLNLVRMLPASKSLNTRPVFLKVWAAHWCFLRWMEGSHQHQVKWTESQTPFLVIFQFSRLCQGESLSWRYHFSSTSFSPFLTKSLSKSLAKGFLQAPVPARIHQHYFVIHCIYFCSCLYVMMNDTGFTFMVLQIKLYFK